MSGVRNKMSDMQNLLMAQMERLNEEDLTPEQIKAEVTKAKAMSMIAGTLIESAKVETHMLLLEQEKGIDIEHSFIKKDQRLIG